MLKRLLTYFLLLNFLNTVFFCNNEPEDYNIFKSNQAQVGEINSIVEYVVEECLDIKDATPEDEDDDWEDPFKTEKDSKCLAYELVFEYKSPVVFSKYIPYSAYYNSTFHKVFLEIKSPPPKRA